IKAKRSKTLGFDSRAPRINAVALYHNALVAKRGRRFTLFRAAPNSSHRWKRQAFFGVLVRNGGGFLETVAIGFGPAVGFADLGDAAYGHMGRESEILAQSALLELLKFDLVGRPEAESFACEPIGGGVESLHGAGKLLGLIPIRQKLCLQCQFQAADYSTSSKFYYLNVFA